MQESIDRILEGSFDYENGSLDFSCTKIEINIPAGEDFEGSFRIRSTPGRLTDGHVSTTDFRMECLTPEFTGSDEEIAFCFHGKNTEEGDVIKGDFNIISNHGEYYIPFVVSVEYTILNSSIGTIKNLFHFANLAKSNWQEAVKLFYSPDFVRVFTGSDAQHYDSYRGLSVYPGNEQNVEEFLIQINKKQQVEFLVEEKEVLLEMGMYDSSYHVMEREIEIVRNGWGYTVLNVECDGDFLFTEKTCLTENDFLGNRCRLPVYIDSNVCRQGKNFGRVVLYNSHVMITIPVTVRVGESGRTDRSLRRVTVQLMEFYQAFRMKKISSSTWLKETTKLVDKLIGMDEQNVPARLFQAQLLISEERYNEAKWILDHVSAIMEREGVSDNTLYAYYLYLTTLIHREPRYVNEVAQKVQGIYGQDYSQWRVAWLLLYLSEEYSKSPSGKWMFLEKQFLYGCSSPILYIEAIFLLVNNPSLLRKLDAYELQVLYYGAKHQMISSELTEQILYLAGRGRQYSPVLLAILKIMYEKKKDVRVLQEICTLLIRGQKSTYNYFEWYRRGVEAQLRITNLFEYYMMSLDLSVPRQLPKILLMYFSYQNNLDYRHSAYLYQYVYEHKEDYAEIYENYRVRIERFVVEQIHKKHINRHLAALYQAVLTPGMITEETAVALSQLLFAHQVRVKDDRLRKVIVYQAGNLRAREYPLQEDGGWISLYGNDYTIIFEDGWGNRFEKNVDYTLEKLMMPGKFLRMIAPYNKNCLELDQYLCETEHSEVTAENIDRILRVAGSEDVAWEVRNELHLKVVQFYYDTDNIQKLDEYLENIPNEKLSMQQRGMVLKYLVSRGKYETAYFWLAEYGPYFADAKILVRLLGEIMRQNNMVRDHVLDAAAKYVFQKGKYDSTILSYLAMYFEGMTKDMRAVWKAAMSFGVECYNLSEKIIVQMLYTGAFIGEKMEIFRFYVSQGAKPEIEEAFLMQCSYDYFVKEKITDSYIFREIRYAYLRGEEIPLVCKLAFLKYFAENPRETEAEDEELIAAFLAELLGRGIRLNFFRELKGFEYLTGVMSDKTIVEYQTRPGGKARIHYVMMDENGRSGEYLSEYMTDVYSGICFKEFILFFGETLQYYITEEFDGDAQLTVSDTIQKSDIVSESRGDKYEILNDIMISKTLQDYDTLDDLLEEYCRKEQWNGQLFELR